ncbi:MAG: septum formation initiator family protein [bacterium]
MRREFGKKMFVWNFESITKFLIFVLIFLIFIKSFIWGNKGFIVYKQMQKDINVDLNKITETQKEIARLKTDIDQWQNNDFMIEKMARQELQMALPDEKIYVLKKQ